MKLFKEIVESQSYQMLASYKLRFKIGNKLSCLFDENEGEILDNIRVQYHLNEMKDEQDFKEMTLKLLANDIMNTFKDFMEEYKTQINETNARISNESNLVNERFTKIEQNLQNRIIKSEEDNKIILNEYMKNFQDLKLNQNEINQNLKRELAHMIDYQDDLTNKFEYLTVNFECKNNSITSLIQNLSKDIENIEKMHKDSYQSQLLTNETLNNKLMEIKVNLTEEQENNSKNLKELILDVRSDVYTLQKDMFRVNLKDIAIDKNMKISQDILKK